MKLKKLTSLLVSLVVAFSFAGCSKVSSESNKDKKNESNQAVPYDDNDDKDNDAVEDSDKDDDDDKDSNSSEREYVVYNYDVDKDELVANIFKAEKVTPQVVFDKLKELGIVTKDAKMNSFDISEADGVDTGFLDVNKEFINPNLGSSAEGLMLDAVAQSFIDNFDIDQVQLSVDEGIYESGHIVLDAGDFLKPQKTGLNQGNGDDVEADEN